MQSPTLKPCEASNAREQLCLMFVTSIKVSWIGSFVKTLEKEIKVGTANLEQGFAVSSQCLCLPCCWELHFQHLWVKHCTILSNNSWKKPRYCSFLLLAAVEHQAKSEHLVFRKFIRKFILLAQEMRGKKFPRSRSWRGSFCIKHWVRQGFAACMHKRFEKSALHHLLGPDNPEFMYS